MNTRLGHAIKDRLSERGSPLILVDQKDQAIIEYGNDILYIFQVGKTEQVFGQVVPGEVASAGGCDVADMIIDGLEAQL